MKLQIAAVTVARDALDTAAQIGPAIVRQQVDRELALICCGNRIRHAIAVGVRLSNLYREVAHADGAGLCADL